jgi:S-adenosylmethionine:tRNA ribosyltransferase-isomerase
LDPDFCPWQTVVAIEEETDLFIYPGFTFRAVDVMLTNFHLPRSSLLMLVSTFAGLDLTRQAYQIAIAEKYRFYSFGDAMLII